MKLMRQTIFKSVFSVPMLLLMGAMLAVGCDKKDDENVADNALTLGTVIGQAENRVGYVAFDQGTQHWYLSSDPAELDEHPDSVYGKDGELVPRTSITYFDYHTQDFYPVALDKAYQQDGLRVVFSGSYSAYPQAQFVNERYVIQLQSIRKSEWSRASLAPELLGRWELKGVEHNGQYQEESEGQWMELGDKKGVLHRGDSLTAPFILAIEGQEMTFSATKMLARFAFRLEGDTLRMTTIAFEHEGLVFIWDPEADYLANATLVYCRME